jgi:hypothetical protein
LNDFSSTSDVCFGRRVYFASNYSFSNPLVVSATDADEDDTANSGKKILNDLIHHLFILLLADADKVFGPCNVRLIVSL